MLLGNGANVNAVTGGGATPLHRASYQGHSQVVTLLMEAGADPRIQV